MNILNYASLEASKRLVEAGIVLETDFYHVEHHAGGYYQQAIVPKIELLTIPKDDIVEINPAPSMAEVWRELLKKHNVSLSGQQEGLTTAWTYAGGQETSPDIPNTNPTDALIDLLIWVKEKP